MFECRTFKDYIERSLFTYESIYPNKMAVMEHILCVLGNGVELNDDGYLDSELPHPESMTGYSQSIYIAKESINLINNTRIGYPEEEDDLIDKLKSNIKKAKTWKKRYESEDMYYYFYPVCQSIFIPEKFKGCKCVDFEEHVKWFISKLNSIDVDQLTITDIFKKDISIWSSDYYEKEFKNYVQNIKDWQNQSNRILSLYGF